MNVITNKNMDFNARKAVVYVDNTAIDTIIDKWFNDNKIYDLDFKCRTWAWIIARRNEVIIDNMRKVIDIDEEYDIRYSRYAGCRCGCSPGFLIKHEGRNMRDIKIGDHCYNNVRVSIDTEEYISQFKKYCETATNKLNKEIQRRRVSNKETI